MEHIYQPPLLQIGVGWVSPMAPVPFSKGLGDFARTHTNTHHTDTRANTPSALTPRARCKKDIVNGWKPNVPSFEDISSQKAEQHVYTHNLKQRYAASADMHLFLASCLDLRLQGCKELFLLDEQSQCC